MTSAVPDILARIVEHKKNELGSLRHRLPELEQAAETRISDRRNFTQALKTKTPAIISEIKKASPSKGVLSTNFDPASIAREYEAGGAACLSVLTDQQHFHGGLGDLAAARASVALPTLRKDFTLDSVHVVEAAAHGADAVLLIAAILTERQMRDLRELAAKYQMAALVEVHDNEELAPALSSGAEIVGVNNRNLHTFEVRLQTSLDLAPQIPSNVVRVSESGIRTRGDIQILSGAGYQAFLIGEHLMRSGQPKAALQELIA